MILRQAPNPPGPAGKGYPATLVATRGREAAMLPDGKVRLRASTSQMGRFETELLANNENLAADYSVVVVLSGLLPPNAPIMSVLLTVPPMCSCSAPMNRPVTKPFS